MSEGVIALESPRRPRAVAWVAERREVVAWWAGSRLIVIACAIGLHFARGPRGYFGPKDFHPLLGPLQGWDGIWYRHIAQHGYLLVPGRQSDPAFFPLYPLLLKVLGWTGMPLALGGILLSNVLFLAALLAFDAFSTELFPRELARRATLLLAVFPTTYVCSMIYPESLVLLAFALAGLFAVRGRWTACAAVAAIAALARPEGVLLVLPIAGCVVSRWRDLVPEQRGRAVASVLAAPAAAISFPLYLGWALRDPFAWNKAQSAWGRSFRPNGIFHAVAGIGHELARQNWASRDLSICVVTLALLAVARRAGTPWTWIALGAGVVLLPLGSGSFESDARFALLALPTYWGLAWLCRDRRIFAAVAVLSAVLLAAATLTLPLVFP